MSGAHDLRGGTLFTPADIDGYVPPRQGHEPDPNTGVGPDPFWDVERDRPHLVRNEDAERLRFLIPFGT